MNKKPFIAWDVTNIIEAQVEDMREQAKGAKQSFDEDKAREAVAANDDLIGDTWESLCELLTPELEKRMPDGYWRVDGEHLTWRSLSGYKYFLADNGEDFLSEVLPKCDNTFEIYKDGKNAFVILNSNHDSPMHNSERYEIRPAYRREIEAGWFN